MPKTLRRYTTHNGNYVLISWMQNKCEVCKRYLRNHQRKYCDRCKSKSYKNGRTNWYKNFRELMIEHMRKYYLDHKESLAKYNKSYRLNHVEECRLRQKNYNRTHKEQIKNRLHQYYLKQRLLKSNVR